MSVALWALLPLLVGPQEPGGAPSEAVAREVQVREWALDLGAARDALQGELAAAGWSAWPRRFAAVDALVRGLGVHAGSIEPWMGEALRGALADPQPNVRARALAGARWVDPLPGPLLEELAADVPQVREALAVHLQARHGAERDALLRRLAADPDARVAAVAWDALVGWHALPDTRVTAFRQLEQDGDADGLLRAFEVLERDVPDPVVPQVLRRLWPAPTEDPWDRAWRAVLEAVDPRDPELLVAGWVGEGERDPRRQALLVRVGRHGDAEVGRALLRFLDTTWAGEAQADLAPDSVSPGDPATPTPEEQARAMERFHLRHDLFDAAYASLGGRGLRTELGELALRPTTLAFVLEEAGPRVTAWGPGASRWIDPGLPVGVRRAAVQAFAQTLARTGDPGSRDLLARAVEDGDTEVRAVVWSALREAGVTEPLVAPLLALGDDAFLSQLERFPQGPLPDPFRGRLLTIGAERGARSSAVVERLASWPGDAGVRAAVEGWLGEQLAALGALEDTAPDAEEFRAVELAAMGCLRTLAALGVESSLALLVEALEVANGRSTEVGKTAARALAAPGEPVERLAAFVHGGVDRRTRIEAAIGVARHAGTGEVDLAVEALIADLPQAAWNLRVRMIEALGRAGTPEARAFLRELPFDPEREPEDRMRALEALARLGDELDALLEAARRAQDPDSRFVAVTLLAAEPAAGASLRALAEEFAGPEADGDDVLRGDERRELHLRVLTALARRGEADAGHRAAVLGPLLAAAPRTLERRFRGDPVAKPSFRWRGELEFLSALAQRDELAGALASAGPWWTLDATLLFELARRARAHDVPTALTLQRAALVAAGGEPEAPRHVAERGRAVLLGLAWEAEAWDLAARTAADLLAERRALRFPDGVWDAQFGTFDRDAGVDPPARLAAAALQARAWAALGRGDVDGAATAALAAGERLGASRAAAREQERLAAAVDAAR